jgi:uncharacterized protein with HEPN domain
MSKREPLLLLQDILDAISRIESYTRGYTQQAFMSDSKTADAVVRNFEIIGEAANRIPEEIRELHTEVNWHRVRGLRNRLVHDYMGVDNAIVWAIVENDLDDLKSQVSRMFNKY